MRLHRKKIFMYFLVAAICMGIWGSISLQNANADEFYQESEEAQFNETVGLLKKLGVIDPADSTKMATTVTNAHFLKLAAGVIHGAGAMTEYGTVFGEMTDMLASPQSEVTYENAARVVVSGLGYSFYREQYSSYTLVAHTIGLFDGIQQGERTYITYGDVMKLFDNALSTRKMVILQHGDEIIGETGDILLMAVHSIRKEKGIVTATQVTGLLGKEKVGKGQVEIDDSLFDTQEDAAALLGRSVHYYLRDGEVVYLCENSAGNTQLTIGADDIIGLQNNTYTYDEEGKSKTAKLSTPHTVIYNGIAATVAQLPEFVPENGSVTLLDNNNDGLYDVVFVQSYQIYKVEVANEKEELLYLENGGDVTMLDLSQYDRYDIAVYGGGSAGFSDLHTDDIVLVEKSDAAQYVHIAKMAVYVSGTVDAIETGDERRILVDGTWYELASGCYQQRELKVGESVSFTVADGKIVGLINGKADSQLYAVYVKSALESKISSELELKLFDETGKMLYLNAADTVTFNGEGLSEEETFEKLSGNETQLIRYSLNDSGEVNQIITAYNYTKDEDYSKITEGSTDVRLIYSSTLMNEGGLTYRPVLKTMDGRFAVTSNALMFQIPENLDSADDGDYYVTSFASTVTNDTYNLDAYTDEENANAANILVCRGSGVQQYGNYIGIVRSITQKLDDEGNVREYIEFDGPPGIEVGIYRTDEGLIGPYRNDAAAKIYKMDVGDMVRCTFTGNEGSFQMVYDLENDFLAPADVGLNYAGYHHYILGRVYAKEGNHIRFTKTREDISQEPALKDTEVYDLSQFKLRKVTNENGKIKVSDAAASDMVDYKTDPAGCSKVFVYSNEGYPWTMVIYE